MGAKAKADGEALSYTAKESAPDVGNSTAHEGRVSTEAKQKGRMPIVAGGFERNIPDAYDGATPVLSVAAEEGNLETVKTLVKHGAEIDATDSEDRTALQKASMKGHKTLVAYLLDHGANVYHADEYGLTSIHLAAQFGFTEIVQLLIESGADLQRPSLDGWTPLHLCYDQPETTHCLLKNGADVNDVGILGCTSLYFAALHNHPEAVKMLLSFNPDLEIISNRAALTAATRRGNPEVVRLLLEAGANVNHRIGQNSFPLQFAVAGNRENTLRILMEYNRKVNLVDDDGDTALHCIRSGTSVSIVKILINGGADPNIRNNEQDTPICKAVLFNNSEVVKYLLAKKAELNIPGGKHGGPLHIACYQSNLHFVKILVDAGADVNFRDPVVGTPLQSACCGEGSSKEEQESVILYLINEANVDIEIVGGPYGCAFNAACGRSSSEVVRLMLEKGVRINVKDKMGRMAIHFAAARSKENFLAIFECGVDVEVADEMGRTALHWASVGGMVYVVNHIISLSSGLVDQADRDGWTPLLWAARGSNTKQRTASSSEQEGVIEFLLDRDSDPCVRTKWVDQDWSPVRVAKYHGVDGRVIRLLEGKAKEKLEAMEGEDSWDEEFHASRKAARKDSWCDCCFLVGIILMMSPVVFGPSTIPLTLLSTTFADVGI